MRIVSVENALVTINSTKMNVMRPFLCHCGTQKWYQYSWILQNVAVLIQNSWHFECIFQDDENRLKRRTLYLCTTFNCIETTFKSEESSSLFAIHRVKEQKHFSIELFLWFDCMFSSLKVSSIYLSILLLSFDKDLI